MLWKKKEEKVLEPVDIQTGVGLLQKQIEQADKLMNCAPIAKKDIKVWNEQTEKVLTRIYGAGSPNIDTIVGAAGNTPVWLFMPVEVAEKYEKSSLENKIRLLEGCVVALKRKEKESQIS